MRFPIFNLLDAPSFHPSYLCTPVSLTKRGKGVYNFFDFVSPPCSLTGVQEDGARGAIAPLPSTRRGEAPLYFSVFSHTLSSSFQSIFFTFHFLFGRVIYLIWFNAFIEIWIPLIIKILAGTYLTQGQAFGNVAKNSRMFFFRLN